ncbi:MAG: hypothetical protein LBU91_09660 [Bacteroidales bacterium]|nr:hypothetical protein [Bacteroidales bacterium]
MRSESPAEGEDIVISTFNFDFYWGIPIFYPELTKSKEYINGCIESNNFCEFDKPLYDLLVKTIKSEYKDLK